MDSSNYLWLSPLCVLIGLAVSVALWVRTAFRWHGFFLDSLRLGVTALLCAGVVLQWHGPGPDVVVAWPLFFAGEFIPVAAAGVFVFAGWMALLVFYLLVRLSFRRMQVAWRTPDDTDPAWTSLRRALLVIVLPVLALYLLPPLVGTVKATAAFTRQWLLPAPEYAESPAAPPVTVEPPMAVTAPIEIDLPKSDASAAEASEPAQEDDEE